VKGTAMEECTGMEGETTAESPRNHLDNAFKNMALQGQTDFEPQAKKTRLEPDIEAAQKNEVNENVTRDECIQDRRRKVPKRTPTVTIHQDFYKYLPNASPSIVPETILARYRLPPPACNTTALVLWSPPQEDSLGKAVPRKEEDETAQEDTLNRENDLSDVHMEDVYSEVENDIEKKIGETKKGSCQGGDTLWLEDDTNME